MVSGGFYGIVIVGVGFAAKVSRRVWSVFIVWRVNRAGVMLAVPLNTLLKQDEYAFFLEELNTKAVIVPEGAFCGKHAAVRAALIKGVGIVNSILSSRGCHIRTIVRLLYLSNTQN